MATTDNNLQVVNSMTEEMLSSLKDSSGKIPSLANQLVMTDDENSENYYKAGNGISIENGVISADDTELRNLIANKVDKVSGKGLSTNDYTTAEKNKLAGLTSTLLKGAMCRKLPSDMAINTSVKTVAYGTQLASIGTGITYSGGYFVAGSGITAMKFNFSNAFYNMTTVGYLQMNFRKNDSAISNYELWTFYDSGLSGSGGGTVLIPCTSGDKISIHIKITTGTGYLNNNSYVEVEAF